MGISEGKWIFHAVVTHLIFQARNLNGRVYGVVADLQRAALNLNTDRERVTVLPNVLAAAFLLLLITTSLMASNYICIFIVRTCFVQCKLEPVFTVRRRPVSRKSELLQYTRKIPFELSRS